MTVDTTTSADFVPLAQRHRGLTIRSYTRRADGSITGDTGVLPVDPKDVAATALHSSATWPACMCSEHGGRPATTT
ncbi:hypothetical protein [Streptomyces sp. CBMA123]|uniref:hypothetical protein n=1 Tax=Streptomyces sp. CBMA123 TaxID=1896313 RepID=UPI001661E073|nr:hypothetical protein [Streptomyces sp. CBMA123]MBD0688504.1 hypothetical protein [Streptomyces sp. CBMA123]